MFCHKCGSKAIESSAFCPKCGEKLISDTTKQPVTSPSVEQTPLQATEIKLDAPKKKKSKKLLFGIGGIALAVVIAIIIAVSSGIGGEETNLFQIAEGVSPMTDSGFDATYGDVFEWLMTNEGTRLEQQGDATDLTYSGKVTGGDYPVTIVLRVTGLGSSDAQVIPYTMTLNGNEVPDFNNPQGVLSDLFWAHDNRKDYPTFMDYVRWDNENAFGTFRKFLDGQDGQYGGTASAASPNSSLVGQWKPVSDDFISFFNPLDTEFFTDGTVVAKGNISDIVGLWTDSGDGQLSITDEAGDTYIFSYEISADSLTLTDSEGDSSTFMRIGGANQGTADVSGGIIGIGDTQVFSDEYFGNMEVTLTNASFVNSAPYGSPDPGHTYLYTEWSVKNIGTTPSNFSTGWGTVVYAGEYEYGTHISEPAILQLTPLSEAGTTVGYTMIPENVVESIESLVIRFGDTDLNGVFNEDMSFTIRPGAENSTGQDTVNESGSEPLSRDEAYELVQAWKNSHPLPYETFGVVSRDAWGDGTSYHFSIQSSGDELPLDIEVMPESGEMFTYDAGFAEPLDDWYSRLYGTADTGAPIGTGPVADHEQAYIIAKAWLDAHPDMEATINEEDNKLSQSNGEEYYQFDFGGSMYYASLLVNSKTGELLIMIFYDGEEPYSEIEPLDDYYDKYYGDVDGAYSEQSSDEQVFNYIQEQASDSSQTAPSKTTFTLTDTVGKPTSSGNVYIAPMELTSQLVGFVNILNPDQVRYGCTIQVTSEKNSLTGLWNTYNLDEDGVPGGTVYLVVDAVVID